MGSQQNSNNTNSDGNLSSKSSKSKKQLEDPQSKSYLNDSLSYKGIKSEGQSFVSCESALSVQTNEKSYDSTNTNNTVPYTFEWKEGGEHVYVTGSFCGWKQQLVMSYNSTTGYFEATLPLIKNTYQFKFIVDSNWKCSSYLPTITDQNNNVNNYIDLTNINTANTVDSVNTSNTSNNNNNTITNTPATITNKAKPRNTITNNTKGKDVPYGTVHPDKMELNSDAPNVPMVYNNTLNLSKRIDNSKVGNKVYLRVEEKNILSENNSFKTLKLPSHVNLNHLGMQCKYHKGFVTVNTTFRVRKKFTSFVYCHPYKK